jgi:phosphoadenosine phosphosulfate reductase
VNPLANWSFKQVQAYVKEHDVPYNELLDRGYKSVGDWHSTQPVAEGEDERAGRWKGQEKTECGIHNKRSRYAQYLVEMERKRQTEELELALAEAAQKVATEQEVVVQTPVTAAS